MSFYLYRGIEIYVPKTVWCDGIPLTQNTYANSQEQEQTRKE